MSRAQQRPQWWFGPAICIAWGIAIALVGSSLGGCSPAATVVRDRPVEVRVAVPQACAGTRPGEVKPLKEEVPPPSWSQLDVRQKAARVGAKGLERQTYGENLNAATAECP